MKIPMRSLWLVPLAATLLLGAPTFAQDEHQMDEATMMKAWQEAMTPGAAHQTLASMAGTWNIASKMWMDPAAPAMEYTGTSVKSMILGNRFLKEEMKTEVMGMPMDGRGHTGYNNTTGKVEMMWMDSTGTMIMTAEGTIKGNTIEVTSRYIDPIMKTESVARMVTTIVDADHHTFTMHNVMGGQEVKTMEAHYTRVK